MEPLFDMLFGQPNLTEVERKRQESLARAAALRGGARSNRPFDTLGGVNGASELAAQTDAYLQNQNQGPELPYGELTAAQVMPPPPPAPAQKPAGGLARAKAQAGIGGGTAGAPGAAGAVPGGVAGAPPAAPGGREADLMAEQARLMQGPDRSAMEAAYKRNQDQGSQGMLLALAAQEAGNQPISAHYLKRAADAQAPMKTAGGTMTGAGFIPDADYANNQQLALVNQKIAREQHIIDAATSEKTKEAAEKRRQQFEMEKLRISEAGAWGRANLAAGTKAAGAGGKTTEDQGKAAGWFVSGRQAMNDMRRVLTEDPKAGDMGFGERTAIAVLPRALGEDTANALRSPARQQFVNAAEAMTDSLLRAATGAGVNYDEAERKRRQLIPQLGDSTAVKQQKLRNYETEMAALAARAGPALDKLPPNMGGHGMPTPPLTPVMPGGGGKWKVEQE